MKVNSVITLEFKQETLNYVMDNINSLSISFKGVPIHTYKNTQTHTHLQQKQKTEHSKETSSKAKQLI